MDGCWNPKRAAELIEEHGRTRKWIAARVGVELVTLNAFLNGRRRPKLPVLILMAQALETTVEDLVSDSKQSSPARKKAAATT